MNHDWRAKNRRTNFNPRQDSTPSTPSFIIICIGTGGKKTSLLGPATKNKKSRYRRHEDKATTTNEFTTNRCMETFQKVSERQSPSMVDTTGTHPILHLMTF
jgi:hypothetical protein